MYTSAHVKPSSATEQLTTQMLRAQELQEHFHTRSEQFRHWMSNYHQQMQRFYTKKIGYHERMEQLYKDQLLDFVAPHLEIEPVGDAPVMQAATALVAGMDAAVTDVTDAQWMLIASLLPLGKGRGRPYVDDRRTLNGILFVISNNVGWSHMPPHYGSYVTCWRRFLRWQDKGVWAQVQHVLQQTAACEQLDTPVYSAAHSDKMAYSMYTAH